MMTSVSILSFDEIKMGSNNFDSTWKLGHRGFGSVFVFGYVNGSGADKQAAKVGGVDD